MNRLRVAGVSAVASLGLVLSGALSATAAPTVVPASMFPCTLVTPCGDVWNIGNVGVGISPENYWGDYKWVLKPGDDSSNEFTSDVARLYVGTGYLAKIFNRFNGVVTWAGGNGYAQYWLNYDEHVTVEAKRCVGPCRKW